MKMKNIFTNRAGPKYMEVWIWNF